MSNTVIALLVVIGVLLVGFVWYVVRLPTSTDKWTPNEKATLILGVTSLVVAGTTLVLSITSTETREAVDDLARLAGQAQLQSRAAGKQVRLLSDQFDEQRTQSGFLHSEADAAQRSVEIARRQLGINQTALVRSNYQAAAAATYKMRLDSFITYVKGQAAYEAALEQITYSLPTDLDHPETVNKLTLGDLAQLRVAVEPIIDARRDEQASFRATLPAWPNPIRAMLVSAGRHGDYVGHCFEMAALRSLNDEEAAVIRQRINANCSNLIAEYNAYRAETDEIWRAMTREVYKNARSAGANPEAVSPDPRG